MAKLASQSTPSYETPSRDFHRGNLAPAKDLPRGLEAFLHDKLGYWHRRPSLLWQLKRKSREVIAEAERYRQLDNDSLREKLQDFHDQFRRSPRQVRKITSAALGAVTEQARRVLELQAYPEQLTGTLGLFEGNLIEMATGEGKTLTLALAAVLRAWTGLPCHIVTANDYLAHRDASSLASFYGRCGLTVGYISATMQSDERKKQYSCDIVYLTSKELLADFLRDRMQLGILKDSARITIRTLLNPQMDILRERLVLRGIHTVLVDEADNILIDEAVTPLIISRPTENDILQQAIKQSRKLADQLVEGLDYTIDPVFQQIEFTKEGLRNLENMPETTISLFRNHKWRLEVLQQAIKAKAFYERDKKYVVQKDKIVIVDEGTGRLMPNRTWRQGLHQAIEAKEGLPITHPSETLASMSFQRFFRLVPFLAGVTGTARENAREFWRFYELPVLTVPTHKPCIRKTTVAPVSKTEEQRWSQIVNEIKGVHKIKRPILVGTRNVFSSEKLAKLLDAEGLNYQLLNAVQHQTEAKIVAEAGQLSRITIATNMAGRGTDIIIAETVACQGGLHVIASEHHEALRIDRQLYGRCARQGDPGSVRQFVSLADEVVERFTAKPLLHFLRLLHSVTGPLAQPVLHLTVRRAQKKASRYHFKQRLNVIEQDRWFQETFTMKE